MSSPAAAAALLLAVSVAPWPVLAQAPPPLSSDYVIYDTGRREVVDLAGMTARLDEADVVFFGETHDDSLAHALEDSTYALLLERRGDVTLSLEMFETDVQPVVDEYLAGLIDADRLAADARAWGNYRVAYHPMVERARAAGQDVVAANAAGRYTRLVGRRGPSALDALPGASREFLPPYPFRYVDTAYRARFFGLMGGMAGHGSGGGELPPGHPPIASGGGELSPFFAAQMLWDATMAHSIAQARPRRAAPVYHVTGSFHVEYRQGTVSQLRNLKPRLRSGVIIVTAPDEEVLDGRAPSTEADWRTLAQRADFVIVHARE